MDLVKRSFQYLALEGTHYDIGRQIGEFLIKDKENDNQSLWRKNWLSTMTSKKVNPRKFGFSSFQQLQEFYQEGFPGINDEIEGLADSINTTPNKIAIYGFPKSIRGNCSHIVALPSITDNNHVLVGRTYEWHFDDEDLLLISTRVNGKNAVLGFSCPLIGRLEGINDKDLCITMSGGGAYDYPMKTKRGLFFGLAIRSLLENCATADEAVARLKELPIDFTANFLIADKFGVASLLECLDSDYSIRRIDSQSPDQFLVSTNHYTLPGKTEFNKYVNAWLLPNSKTRYQTIQSTMAEGGSKITKETLRTLLATEMPEGIMAYWYRDYFGTLWSMIFDITDGTVEVAFGPPSHNTWHEFTPKNPGENKEFMATFPDKPFIVEDEEE